MELFYIAVIMCLIILNMACLYHLYKLVYRYTEIHVFLREITAKLDSLESGFDRNLLELRERLEPTKPIKSNNWDSIRAAFKGPVRLDERD